MVCENDALIAPPDWSDVPVKSISISPSAAVTAASTWKRLPASNPSPSMVNVPRYVPPGMRSSSSRMRRSVVSIQSCTNRPSVSAPCCSIISSMRRPIVLAPAINAWMSPMALSGVRLLPAMMRSTSLAGTPARDRCTGGSIRPSANVSVASAARPPAETPPTSAMWISVPPKYATRPSANTGRNTSTSLAWMPPRYGSFSA